MKWVTIKTKIKHDSQTFYPEERRFLDADTAAYFAKHGWAAVDGEEVAAAPAPADAELEVQSVKHTTKGKAL